MIKTNERELSGEVKNWFQSEMERNTYFFTSATNEVGAKTASTTRFGDITLWQNREANEAFLLLELKPPNGNTENLKTFEQKAIALNVKFACTWDFQNLHVYTIDEGKLIAAGSEPTPILDKIEDWLRGDKQALIKTYISRFCIEFENFSKTGKFTKFNPDKIYFVNLTRATVDRLSPLFNHHIRLACADINKKRKIDEYVVKQGINYPSTEAFFELIAAQRVYGLVTKIIFYLTIRRYFEDLPAIGNQDEDLNISLKNAFAKAREKDWQAVFEDGPIEELGIPESSYAIFYEFLNELTVYHFGNLPEDVLGELFQEIIDPDKRHTLGQYFTKEDLVDFVIALIVKNPEGIYCDPTCGSGTFLIRLYDRLRYLKPAIKHTELLSQIWGFDIGSFPAELSTINLFRQDPSNFENFPKVRTINIFDVKHGMTFDFPPPNAGKMYFKVQEKMPEINGFVGNFPFVRQELIEKKDPTFKKYLTKLIAYEYLASYPQLFEIKNKALKEELKFAETTPSPSGRAGVGLIDNWVEKGWIELKLSSQADLYAYIYIHLTTLLAPQGEFAIITSNSWLDVAYGAVLKQFFLDHFAIKTIIGSWAEPWFDDAAVNCVITVLERQPDVEKRNQTKTSFVKLKQPFKQLVPYGHEKFESYNRWLALDNLEHTISCAQYFDDSRKEINIINEDIRSYESPQMRIRIVNQSYLATEVAEKAETSKWGKYLRAPDVYFEILDKCKDKLKPLKTFASIKRGYTTGLNEFFYLKLMEPLDLEKRTAKVQNGAGYVCEIEHEYLKKVILSSKEFSTIVLENTQFENYMFVCNKTKDELIKSNHFGAYNYIEYGETQRTKTGVIYDKVPSVTNRKYWYGIEIKNKRKILIPRFIDKRYIFSVASEDLLVGDTFFILENDNKINNEIFFNSTIFHLFIESEARTNLGDGLLTFYGPDIRSIPFISNDLKLKSKNIARKIGDIFSENKNKTKKDLDLEVLNILGLDAKILPIIYENISDLVKERLSLPEMRKSNKKQKVIIAYNDIKKSVIKDIIPYGFRHFPDAFIDLKSIKTTQIPTSGKPLLVQSYMMGTYILEDNSKQAIADVYGEAMKEYALLYSRLNPGKYQIIVPEDENEVVEVINLFKSYLKEITEQVRLNAYQKLHDWSLAEKMAKEIVGE